MFGLLLMIGIVFGGLTHKQGIGGQIELKHHGQIVALGASFAVPVQGRRLAEVARQLHVGPIALQLVHKPFPQNGWGHPTFGVADRYHFGVEPQLSGFDHRRGHGLQVILGHDRIFPPGTDAPIRFVFVQDQESSTMLQVFLPVPDHGLSQFARITSHVTFGGHHEFGALKLGEFTSQRVEVVGE